MLLAAHHPSFVHAPRSDDSGVGGVNHGSFSEKYDDHDDGDLRIIVDKQRLRIAYHQAGARSLLQSRFDLAAKTLLPNA